MCLCVCVCVCPCVCARACIFLICMYINSWWKQESSYSRCTGADGEAWPLTSKGFFSSVFKINVYLWGYRVFFVSFLNISFDIHIKQLLYQNKQTTYLYTVLNEPEFFWFGWIIQDCWPLFLVLSLKKTFTLILSLSISLILCFLCFFCPLLHLSSASDMRIKEDLL